MWILYVVLTVTAVAAAVTAFAILPRRRRDTSPFNCTVYAHRGLYDNNGHAPENSLAAFRAAKEAGYGVELDVRFTADRQIVVFHDDTLERMCGDNRRVDECTYEQLQELRLLHSDERIPLLSEVLKTLNGVTVLCEIKPMRSYFDASLCEAAYQILSTHNGAYCIESFNPYMVRWFRKHAPNTIRGILSKRYEPNEVKPAILGPLLSSLMTNFLCRPDFIAYQYTDWKHPFFRLCRLLRPMLLGWTIRNPEQQKMAEQAFDSFIFEGYRPILKERKTFLKKV